MTDSNDKRTCKHALLIYMTPSALHGVSDDFSWLSSGYDEGRLAQLLSERLWRSDNDRKQDRYRSSPKEGPFSFTQDFDNELVGPEPMETSSFDPVLENTLVTQPLEMPADSSSGNQPMVQPVGVDAFLGNQPSSVVSTVDSELLEYIEQPVEDYQPSMERPASEPAISENFPPVMMTPEGGSTGQPGRRLMGQPGRRLMGQPVPPVMNSTESSEVVPSNENWLLTKPSVTRNSPPVEPPAKTPAGETLDPAPLPSDEQLVVQPSAESGDAPSHGDTPDKPISEEESGDLSDEQLMYPSKESVGRHLLQADTREENISEEQSGDSLDEQLVDQLSTESVPESSEMDEVADSTQSARLGVAIEFNDKRGMFERLIERYPGMRLTGLVREHKPDLLSIEQFLSSSTAHPASLSGLADFLVWARTEVRAEHYTLVLLGDLSDVIESGERERENLRASRRLGAAMGLTPFTRRDDRAHPVLGKSKDGNDRPHPVLGKSKDGNDRPHPVLGKSKDGNDRPLSYAMGVGQTDNVFMRARWLIEELRSAKNQLAALSGDKREQPTSKGVEAETGEKVVDRIVADGCTLSFVEVLAELAPFADEVLTAQLPLPQLGGPLGTLLRHSEQDLPSLVREFAGECAEFKDAAAWYLDGSDPTSSEDDRSALASAVENRPTSIFGLGLNVTDTLVGALQQFGASLAKTIELADEDSKQCIYEVLCGLVSWREPGDCNCDLGEMLHTISRATYARDGWAPDDPIRDSVKELQHQLRGVDSVREGLPSSHVGVSVYFPIRVEDCPPADYLTRELLRGPDLGTSSGWARMLAALRRIAFARELDERGHAAMVAERRMHQDMAAFWQRSATVDNPLAFTTRARRGPRRHWGVMCYLSGFESLTFDSLAGRESEDFEVAFQFGMKRQATLGTLIEKPSRLEMDDAPSTPEPAHSGYQSPADSIVALSTPGYARVDLDSGYRLTNILDSSSIAEPSWSEAVRELRERPSLEGLYPHMDFYSSDGIRRFIEWGVEACDARYLCLIVAVRQEDQPSQSTKVPSIAAERFVLLDDGENHRRLSVRDFVEGVRAALKKVGRDRLDLLVVRGVGEAMVEAVHELGTVTRYLHWSVQSEAPLDEPVQSESPPDGPEQSEEPRGGSVTQDVDSGLVGVLDTIERNADLTAQPDRLRGLVPDSDSDKPDADQRRAWDEKMVQHMVEQLKTSSDFIVRTERAGPLFRRLDEVCRYLLRNLDKKPVWTAVNALFQQPVSDSRVALTELLKQLQLGFQGITPPDPEIDEGFNLTSMTLENVNTLNADAMYLHCPDPDDDEDEIYTKLSFHEQVSFYALYTAVVKLQTKKPYELWTMILASISYTSGAVRGDLLRHLSMNSGERGNGSVPFPSLATPPTITLALESHSPDELFSTERAVETTEEARQYRVRLTSSEKTAVLTESVRSVNVRSIDESLAGLDMLLDRGDANGAEMNYLRSLGTSLGEDIVHRLRDRLQGHRDALAPESPGGRVHLKLRIPRELMRYPWELMSDGYGLLAERFAVGRQVWHNSGVARPPTRCDLPLRVLIVGDPALRAPYSSDAQLPGAREEARAVANLFEALGRELGPAMDFQRERDVFINTVITRGAMRELLRDHGYDIVHFAGHGRFHPGYPERSAWVLSDGPLWASELYNTFTWTKSPPWLIYANACEAGMSSDRAPSAYTGEVFGLAAACINQGVAAYIAPLWRISDTAGRLMATEFYRALLQRRSTLGASLLDAREYTQRVLREVPDPFGYFDISWASVTLYGDPSVRLHDTVGRSI